MSNSLPFVVLAVSWFTILGANAALIVVDTPGNFVDPAAEVNVIEQLIQVPSAADPSFIDVSNFSLDYVSASSFTSSLGGTLVFRGTDSPDTSSPIANNGFNFYQVDRILATTSYLNGAIPGDDNWIYTTDGDGNRAWAQVTVGPGTITPIKYVYDPANRTAAITLSDAAAANVPEPSVGLLAALAGLLALRRRR